MSNPPYSAPVWAHFDNPRNMGKWKGDAAQVYTGEARTPAGDDVLRLHVCVCAEDERIVQTRFQAHGGVAVIAVGSWLTEWLSGRKRAEARALTATDIAEQLELSAVQRYCAIMGEDAVRAALSSWTKTDD